MTTDNQDYTYMAGRMRYSVAELANLAFTGLVQECKLLGYFVKRTESGGCEIEVDGRAVSYSAEELASGKALI